MSEDRRVSEVRCFDDADVEVLGRPEAGEPVGLDSVALEFGNKEASVADEDGF